MESFASKGQLNGKSYEAVVQSLREQMFLLLNETNRYSGWLQHFKDFFYM